MSFRLLLIAAGGLALTACNTMYTHIGDEDPAMGEAIAYNKAIQTINPTPVYSAEGAQPGDNGEKGQKAVLRYRSDQVKAVQTIRTSTGSGGGPR